MKVSYKKIKVIRKRPSLVDHYYGMTLEDFFDTEDIEEMEHTRIKHILMRAKGVFVPGC